MRRWVILAAASLFPLAVQARHHHARDDGGNLAPVSGAGSCRTGLSAGSPPVELRHIFCGEINRSGLAVGFHSRPGGTNPPTVSQTGDPRPVRGYPGLYNLFRFQITQDGESGTKGISTLYPDKCSAEDVIAAVQNAYNTGEHRGPKFQGLSGPRCTTDDGRPFPITGFTGGGGETRIRTGYPDIRGDR